MPEFRKGRKRLVILLFRKPGMSLEEFHDYWRNEHSKVFSSIKVVKRNLLKYEQAHNNEEMSKQLKGMGFPSADCDGMAIFEAYSYEKIAECFQDEDYKKEVIPDEEKFLDRGRSMAFPADLVSVIDDPT